MSDATKRALLKGGHCKVGTNQGVTVRRVVIKGGYCKEEGTNQGRILTLAT